MSFWKENKIIFSILLGSGLIALAIYFGFVQQNKGKSASSPAVSPVVESTAVAVPTSTPIEPTIVNTEVPSPTPEIVWKKSDLISALSSKTGIPENEINFSTGDEINQGDKVLLRGTVSREGEMGGAGFFAVVDENGVKVTYVGQGVPACDEVNQYGYPLSWADYCIDNNGDTIAR